MPLLWVVAGIALMLGLVLVVRLDAFLALLLTAFAVGVLAGMDPLAVLQSIAAGVGSTMGSVALVLVAGAMLGALLDESGAAGSLVRRLAGRAAGDDVAHATSDDATLARPGSAGARRVQLALALTGLLVGLPMLYNAGFLVLIPLVYAIGAATGLPLLYLGLPVTAALSVTHGFLPPHPAPTAIAALYGADPGATLLVGLVAAVPAILLGGVVLGRVLTRLHPAASDGAADTPAPAGLLAARARRHGPTPDAPGVVDAPAATTERAHGAHRAPPGFAVSAGTALLPVLLMLVGALVDLAAGTGALDPVRAGPTFRAQLAELVPDARLRGLVLVGKLLGNATVALVLAVLVALWSLGTRRGRRMDELTPVLGRAVAGVAGILMLIAAGGAFSQVLRDAGVAEWVKARAMGVQANPLLLAFGIATAVRVAVGSATVATLTTAGVVAPLVAATGVRPELMVLATGAGSLMCSHLNDTGFWMFKEYYGLGLRATFASWTVMETVVGLVGLGVALLLQAVA